MRWRASAVRPTKRINAIFTWKLSKFPCKVNYWGLADWSRVSAYCTVYFPKQYFWHAPWASTVQRRENWSRSRSASAGEMRLRAAPIWYGGQLRSCPFIYTRSVRPRRFIHGPLFGLDMSEPRQYLGLWVVSCRVVLVKILVVKGSFVFVVVWSSWCDLRWNLICIFGTITEHYFVIVPTPTTAFRILKLQ